MKVPLTLFFLAGWIPAGAEEVAQPRLIAIGIGPTEADPHGGLSEAEWRVADMETDGDGGIWAIAMPVEIRGEGHVGSGSITKLAVFEPETRSWTPHPCEAAGDGAALALRRLDDGSVACLWRSGGRSILTKHRNMRSSAWTGFESELHEPRLCAGAAGGLIITETGPKVVIVRGDEKPPALLTIPDELLTPPEKPEEGNRSHAAVHAINAGDGSVWLWCYALQAQKHLWRIRGFVRWKGDKLEAVAGLRFEADSFFSAVQPDGAGHLFIAEAGATLWRLRLGDGKVEQLRQPGDELAYIEQLPLVGSDLHVVTCPKPDKTLFEASTTVKSHFKFTTTRYYDTSKPTGAVFRIQDGAVETLARGIDDQPGFGRVSRSLVATPEGLMIGSVEGGPTWIENTSPANPRRLGREEGFLRHDAVEVLPVAPGRWLARASDTTWTLVTTAPATAAVPGRVTTLKTDMPIVQDPDFQLWARRSGEEGFAKWSGGRWVEHPEPPVPEDHYLDLTADSHGHAWLISTAGGRSAVLDFASGQWSALETPEEAIEKRLAPGDHLRIPAFLVFGPVSHKNGTKGFLDWNGIVHILQAGKWTRSSLSEIGGPEATATGVPFFDGDGRFCIPVEHRHHRLRGDGRWEEVQGADTQGDRAYDRAEEKPPAESPVTDVTSTAYDRHGIAWMTQRDGSIWKTLGGEAVKVTGSDGKAILPPNTMIGAVLGDERGTAFLKQANSRGPCVYYCVAAKSRNAPAKASLAKTGDGVPTITFPSDLQGWHRHRIGGGEWTRPSRERELVLNRLAPGRHRIEIQTIDDELTPLAAIGILEIEREAAGDDAVRRLIAGLDADSLKDRERAAAELRTQGTPALPRLKEALETTGAGSSLHWWIEAVIQSIERSRNR